MGRRAQRGGAGNLQKSWANFSFFKKSYYFFFFEELLVCVCGYKVVYIMCGCSLNYTFTIQSWKCSFKNFFLSFLLNRFSKIKEIFFFQIFILFHYLWKMFSNYISQYYYGVKTTLCVYCVNIDQNEFC